MSRKPGIGSWCSRWLWLALPMALAGIANAGERITIAAASDLKFALDEVTAAYRAAHRDDVVEVVYGSSGKFQAQIREGAPYDLYFSADIAYPQALVDAGQAVPPVRPYAVGRLVLWSARRELTGMTLADLRDPGITRIAIANPQHAPYGQRAEQALRTAGVWEAVLPRLVYGDNIAQAAQFAQTGNVEIGIIALSLALSPELAQRGSYALVPERLHQPLLQGYAITHRARDNALAQRFAAFVESASARSILQRYGFVVPDDATP